MQINIKKINGITYYIDEKNGNKISKDFQPEGNVLTAEEICNLLEILALNNNKNCIDCINIENSVNCISCTDCENLTNCMDCWESTNLTNCKNCANISNKKDLFNEINFGEVI